MVCHNHLLGVTKHLIVLSPWYNLSYALWEIQLTSFRGRELNCFTKGALFRSVQDKNASRDTRERPQVHDMGWFLRHVSLAAILFVNWWARAVIFKDHIMWANVFWVIRLPELDLEKTSGKVISTITRCDWYYLFSDNLVDKWTKRILNSVWDIDWLLIH